MVEGRLQTLGQAVERSALSVRSVRLLALLLVAVVIAAAAVRITWAREREIAGETRNLSSLGAAVAEQTDYAIQSIELVLSNASGRLTATPIRDAADLQQRAGDRAMYERLRELISGVPQLDAVTIIGRDGTLLNFSRSFPIPAVNVADRDYFQALSVPGAPRYFLSRPVQNRATGTWTIYMAARLDDAQGGFVGLVLGAVLLKNFEDFFQGIRFESGGVISLWRQDGVLLARFPPTGKVGTASDKMHRFATLPPGDQDAGQAVGVMDGLPRLRVVTRLLSQPMLLSVTRRMDDVLADWRADSRAVGAGALLSVLAILAAMALMTRQLRAYAALREAVRARDAAECGRRRAEQHAIEAQKLETIGPVAAGVAHDFNNLLMVVGSRTDRVANHLHADRQVQQWTATIHEAVRQGTKLTQQMLAFSRQQVLSPETLDLNAVLCAMQELLRSSLSAAVRLELALDEALWPVEVDRGQLGNVLLNLVINARDAMPQGGRVTIATRNVYEDGGRFVEIAVTDTGTGMSEAVRARAFEPFFSTKPRGQGTGLGLSQVIGFVRQSHGDVVIDTRLGRGTTIQIRLPRGIALPVPVPVPAQAEFLPPAPAIAPELPEPPVPAAPRRAGAPCVLLVDDNETVRDVVGAMLEQLGVQVVRASGGAEGLRLLADDPGVALVITDYNMPGMTGLDFARQARAIRPGVAFAFVSGYAPPEALDGERWVLRKPFQMHALGAVLREALAEEGMTAS